MHCYTVDPKQIAIETIAIYRLYNAFGRGKIDEVNFGFLVMRNGLGDWIKDNYTKHEIALRLYQLGILEMEVNNGTE